MFQLGRASRSHPRVSDPLFWYITILSFSKSLVKKKSNPEFPFFSVCRNHLRLCLGCHNQERIWDGLTNRKEKGLKTIPSPPPPTFVFFFHFVFVKFRPNWNSAPPTFFFCLLFYPSFKWHTGAKIGFLFKNSIFMKTWQETSLNFRAKIPDFWRKISIYGQKIEFCPSVKTMVYGAFLFAF